MKRLLCYLLTCLTLTAALFGCGKNAAAPTTDPEKTTMLLPQTFTMDIDGETVTGDFAWAENTCTYTMPEETASGFADPNAQRDIIQYTYDPATNALTVALPWENGNTVYTFDDNGYITGSPMYKGAAVDYTITYTDNYTRFACSIGDNKLTGERKEDGLHFTVYENNTVVETPVYTYNDLFVANADGWQYTVETDEDGQWKRLSVLIGEDGDGGALDVTVSDVPLTHTWQRMPLIYCLADDIWGYSPTITLCYAITLCYLGR